MEPQYFATASVIPSMASVAARIGDWFVLHHLGIAVLPKLLSIVLIWAKGAKAYGGASHLLLSMLLEMLFSVLLAPVRMLFHTVFVVSAFLGWSVQWNSPQRDDDATPE